MGHAVHDAGQRLWLGFPGLTDREASRCRRCRHHRRYGRRHVCATGISWRMPLTVERDLGAGRCNEPSALQALEKRGIKSQEEEEESGNAFHHF